MNDTPNRWWPWWNIAVGALDSCTGLLLMIAPAFTLRMMMVPSPPAPALVFVSWIGAFVTAVGLAYWIAPRRLDGPQARARLETVWRMTTIARLLVAAFVTWRIVNRDLPAAWLLVAATDAAIACAQIAWLQAKWFKTAA
jgi:hypothetical protein